MSILPGGRLHGDVKTHWRAEVMQVDITRPCAQRSRLKQFLALADAKGHSRIRAIKVADPASGSSYFAC
ncbi:MAG TPA: hypothetical protein VNR40_21385, partial [Steroidobacter sp.]|nr:hypothetical protein [Steroidobacter sp.]